MKNGCLLQVFGSAGVIGNPMGFARSMGLGLKDFLSAPVQSVFQVPYTLSALLSFQLDVNPALSADSCRVY